MENQGSREEKQWKQGWRMEHPFTWCCCQGAAQVLGAMGRKTRWVYGGATDNGSCGGGVDRGTLHTCCCRLRPHGQPVQEAPTCDAVKAGTVPPKSKEGFGGSWGVAVDLARPTPSPVPGDLLASPTTWLVGVEGTVSGTVLVFLVGWEVGYPGRCGPQLVI